MSEIAKGKVLKFLMSRVKPDISDKFDVICQLCGLPGELTKRRNLAFFEGLEKEGIILNGVIYGGGLPPDDIKGVLDSLALVGEISSYEGMFDGQQLVFSLPSGTCALARSAENSVH